MWNVSVWHIIDRYALRDFTYRLNSGSQRHFVTLHAPVCWTGRNVRRTGNISSTLSLRRYHHLSPPLGDSPYLMKQCQSMLKRPKNHTIVWIKFVGDDMFMLGWEVSHGDQNSVGNKIMSRRAIMRDDFFCRIFYHAQPIFTSRIGETSFSEFLYSVRR